MSVQRSECSAGGAFPVNFFFNPMSNSVLQVENLTKRYGDVQAVRGVEG